MDELDRDGSRGRQLAAAGAAAALFGALALALARRPVLAPGLDAAGAMTADRLDGSAEKSVPGQGIQQLVAQVVEVAPEVVDALEQHAPDTARRLRERLGLVRRLMRQTTAGSGGQAPGAVDPAGPAGVAAAGGDAATGSAPEDGGLSLAQVAAARAAAAAVGRAEQALSAGNKADRSAQDRTNGQDDDLVPALRDLAQQAAEHALNLWQSARAQGVEAGERLRHQAADSDGRDAAGVPDTGTAAKSRARDLEATVERVARMTGDGGRGKADDAAERLEEAVDEAVDAGKEAGAAFMWLVAALGLIFYVLLNEERREQLVRFSDEASVQLRELLRDVRGYDDEF